MKPYTYLIGWNKSNLNYWYYGCQYGKNADPKNLWKSYFTSSDLVQEMRKWHGEPNIIQVDKICKTGDEGKRLSDETKSKLREMSLGRPGYNKGNHHSDETKKRLSETLKGRPSKYKGVPQSEEHRRNRSIAVTKWWAERKNANLR